MRKHDVIQNYTKRIALLSEEDRATATGNIYRKFREVCTCGFWDMRGDRHAYRHIYRHADRSTSHLSRCRCMGSHRHWKGALVPCWNWKTERQPSKTSVRDICSRSIDSKVLGLPLGVQILQSFQLQGASPPGLPSAWPGALPPLCPSDQGLCPSYGGFAPDPRYRRVLRARHCQLAPTPPCKNFYGRPWGEVEISL